MSKAFFLTGTDTGVGKTTVAAGLLHAASHSGLSCYGLKPLAAGSYETPEGLRNEDAVLLQKHSSVSLPYQQVNPVLLNKAAAPHLAALYEGRTLSADRIEGFCRGALMTKADFKLVEGAGGWRVPLNSAEHMGHLAARLKLPVIMVVGLRLGCINHAILTAEAIINDGLPLAGWVANGVDPDMEDIDGNVSTLRHLIPAPLLGVVPWFSPPDVSKIGSSLHLDALLVT